MVFEDLQLSEDVQLAVKATGFTEPTPIQQQAIPLVLQGRDLIGSAQTGTGKTAAFALPMLTRLDRPPQIARPANWRSRWTRPSARSGGSAPCGWA